jgi:hypothetical protein
MVDERQIDLHWLIAGEGDRSLELRVVGAGALALTGSAATIPLEIEVAVPLFRNGP